MSEATKIRQGTEDVTCEVNESVQVEIDDGTVVIRASEYRELVSKAAALDILSGYIQQTGEVDDEIARAVTGTITKEPMVPKKEVDEVWRFYSNKNDENERLKQKIASLSLANDNLKEILRQNGIGPFARNDEEDGGNG